MYEEWQTVQKTIIGYVFYSENLQILHEAISRLRNSYFEDSCRALWKSFVYYNRESSSIPNLRMLRDFWNGKHMSEKEILRLEVVLEECREYIKDVDKGGFTWYLGRLEELYKQVKLAEITDKSSTILSDAGFHKAKDYFLTSLSALEGGYLDEAPDGLLSDEIEPFIQEVSSARDVRAAHAVDFGFPSIDNVVLGLRGGDMCLIAGWTGVGKTIFSFNVAVHASMIQRKNVVFVTTETVRKQARRRLYSRMTKLPRFETPISSQKLKAGELSGAEMDTLLALKKMLKTEPHGVLMVAQAPSKATMDWLRGRLIKYESMFKIDLLILDDIRNMSPFPRRQSVQEETAQLIKDFKRIARTHAGRGVPAISPYHVSREAFRYALEHNKRYNLASLASTAEAERQTDIIMTMWRDEDTPMDIRMDMLKMRDAPSDISFPLRVDLDYQHIYEVETSLDE